ncbi:unnamed protein product [Amoebophrya sp. A25]|nr:unnamed protein product [Amoebophrya sp. A25]|eukprot:GSA25T00015832001.1
MKRPLLRQRRAALAASSFWGRMGATARRFGSTALGSTADSSSSGPSTAVTEAAEYLRYLRERERRKETRRANAAKKIMGSSERMETAMERPLSGQESFAAGQGMRVSVTIGFKGDSEIPTVADLAKEAHAGWSNGVDDPAFWSKLHKQWKDKDTIVDEYSARAALHFLWTCVEAGHPCDAEGLYHFFNQVLALDKRVKGRTPGDILAQALRLLCIFDDTFLQRRLASDFCARAEALATPSATLSAMWSVVFILNRRKRAASGGLESLASGAGQAGEDAFLVLPVLEPDFVRAHVVGRRAELTAADVATLTDACVGILEVLKSTECLAASAPKPDNCRETAYPSRRDMLQNVARKKLRTTADILRNEVVRGFFSRASAGNMTALDCAKAVHGLAKLRLEDRTAMDALGKRLQELSDSGDFVASCFQQSLAESKGHVQMFLTSAVSAAQRVSALSGRDGSALFPATKTNLSQRRSVSEVLKQRLAARRAKAKNRQETGDAVDGAADAGPETSTRTGLLVDHQVEEGSRDAPCGNALSSKNYDVSAIAAHTFLWQPETLPRILAKTAYGFAKFQGSSGAALYDRLGILVRRHLLDFDGAREMGLVLTSFSRAGVANEVLLARMISRVRQWGGEGLLQRIRSASDGTKAVAFQDVLNLAMGFAKFQVKDEKAFLTCFSPVFRSFLPDTHAEDASPTSAEDEIFGRPSDSLTSDPTRTKRGARRAQKKADLACTPLEKQEREVEDLARRFPENQFTEIQTADWVNVAQAYGKVHVLDEPLLRGIADLLCERLLTEDANNIHLCASGGAGARRGDLVDTLDEATSSSGTKKASCFPVSDIVKYVNAMSKVGCAHTRLLGLLVQRLRRDLCVENDLPPFDALQLSQALNRLGSSEFPELETFVATVLPNEIRSSEVSPETRRRIATLPKHRKSARRRKRTW